MQQNEKLSAYMDGYEIGRNLASDISSDPALQQKWANYHTIRSVLRSEELILGKEFSEKMASLLDDEAANTIPSAKPRGLVLQLKKWGIPLMQAGIAASVCFVALIGFNMLNNSEEQITQHSQPAMLTLPFSNAVQQVSYNAPSQVQPSEERLEYQQRLLNSLLQNHELQRRTSINGVTLSDEQKEKANTSATEPKTQKNN